MLTPRVFSLFIVIVSATGNDINSATFSVINQTIFFIDATAEFTLKIAF